MYALLGGHLQSTVLSRIVAQVFISFKAPIARPKVALNLRLIAIKVFC